MARPQLEKRNSGRRCSLRGVKTVMMARRFTAERSIDASIPALRFDASTLDAPLNRVSSRPLALHLLPPVPFPPPRHQADGSVRLRRRTKLWGQAPWAPPGQWDQGEDPSPLDAWHQRPPSHRRAEAGRGEPCRLRVLWRTEAL
jgi:hypothetical protein